MFSEKLPNVFDVSLPVANELDPFVNWIKSLPAGQRPATAAYPMANDPFATPQVQLAQGLLQPLGISTVYSKIFPEEVPDYLPNADLVAGKKPDLVVLGSTDVPTVASFMHGFEQQHFNPKVFIAACRARPGPAFLSAVGTANANGMMVPERVVPRLQQRLQPGHGEGVRREVRRLVHPDVNADVAEAYSVGQVTAAGGQGDRRHRRLEDRRLPAQRRDADQRGRSGEVQQPGRERQGDRVHLPVAERKIRAGAARRSARARSRSFTRSPTGLADA